VLNSATGLDTVALGYLNNFLNNNVGGQQLLNLCASDLEDLGIAKVGHQEIILEAVTLLKDFVRIKFL
jgi:hypothetical protein